MKKLPNKLITTAVIVAGMALPFAVNATNGILPLGNGMTAHGFGGAGIANAADAMSGVDNPALVADTANQMSLGASLFSPIRSADSGTVAVGGTGSGYVESDNKLFVIPQFAWTASVDDKTDTNFAVLVSALGGMNTEYSDKLFGSKAGMDLSGLIVAPTISKKVTKDTSLGLSVLVGYERLETTGPGAGGLPPSKTGSATGTGLKIGIATGTENGTRFGLTYQSTIKMGEMPEHCDEGFLAEFKNLAGKNCRLNMPPMIGTGVVMPVSDKSKIVADVIWVKWSNVEVFADAFGWHDQNILKLGYERKVNDSYTWRVGLNKGKSPVPDSMVGFNLLAPAITEEHLTFGFTKKTAGGNEWVGYYAYVLENEQKQTGAPSVKAKMFQHALGLGYNWR